MQRWRKYATSPLFCQFLQCKWEKFEKGIAVMGEESNPQRRQSSELLESSELCRPHHASRITPHASRPYRCKYTSTTLPSATPLLSRGITK